MTATTVTLRVGLYGRESKDKTKSIDDQLAESRDAAAERAWTVVAEYTDGVSASRFGTQVRRGWRRLLADLDAGELDAIVAWEPSRADRDLETWVAFVAKCRTRGVLVHIVGDGDTLDPRSPSHWHRLISGGVDAAMESEKISKRTLRGVATAAAAGAPHGDVPYGYQRVIVGERATPHGPRPVKEQRPAGTAPVVVEIFKRVGRGDPIVHIVRDLNERGVPGPSGARWERNTLRKIARNPAYVGQRRHKGELHDGTWDGLVDEVAFQRAQQVLDAPDRKVSKPGASRWLLSYLAVAECGGAMHADPGREGRRPSYRCHADGCASVGVAEADEYVTRVIVARLALPDVRAMFAPDDAGVRKAKADLAKLEAKLEGARASHATLDGISAASLADAERRFAPLIADAKRRAVSATVPAVLVELLDAATFGAKKVRPVWDRMPLAARREVVSILATVTVGRTVRRLSRWATDDERLAEAAERITVTPGPQWRSDPDAHRM